MKLWTVIGNGDNDNVISLHKSTASDGTKVSSRMVEMLTGEKNQEYLLYGVVKML